MPRIQVMSDLHVEFMQDHGESFVASLGPSDVDVLVVAGDLCLVAGGSFLKVARLLSARYPQVVAVLGNHEFYRSNKELVEKEVEYIQRTLPNFHILENETVEVAGQRFVGCTLWFPDLPDGLNSHYAGHLNDFHFIDRFQSWVYEDNARSMKFLADTVQAGDVVVTHHIPTLEGSLPKWHSSPLQRFFLCQMPVDVLSKPAFWVHGHTHDSMAFKIGDCQFRCNPFGYCRHQENPQFAEKLVVT